MWPLRDQLLSFRDRVLSDLRFQRFATTSRVMSPIARRQARSLFDLCAGFVYSQVLLACVELDLFRILEAGPLDAEALSAELDLTPEATSRLLTAALALGLVDRRGGGRYGLGMHGAALVANKGIQAMVAHHRALYRDLADPVALLRGEDQGGALAGYWPYAKGDTPGALGEADVASYTQLMSASQTLVAEQVLHAYSLAGHDTLLDVGGGDGTFLCAAARRNPGLRLQLFDLPAVARRAETRFEQEGLAIRAQTFGGSFFDDPLPNGADVVSLVRVLHDHDDDRAQHLLRAVRNVLPRGGVLLIAEPLAGTAGAERMGGAYFGFYLMAMGSGRPREFADVAAMLSKAGFAAQRLVRTAVPLQTSLIVATA